MWLEPAANRHDDLCNLIHVIKRVCKGCYKKIFFLTISDINYLLKYGHL